MALKSRFKVNFLIFYHSHIDFVSNLIENITLGYFTPPYYVCYVPYCDISYIHYDHSCVFKIFVPFLTDRHDRQLDRINSHLYLYIIQTDDYCAHGHIDRQKDRWTFADISYYITDI